MSDMSRRTLLAAAPAAVVAAAMPDAAGGSFLPALPRVPRGVETAGDGSTDWARHELEKYECMARGEVHEDDDGMLLHEGGYTPSPEAEALKSISPVARKRIQRGWEYERALQERQSYGQRLVDRHLKKHPFLRMLT